MRIRKTVILLVAAATSVAASPAFAGPPHTVSVGGVTSGTVFSHLSPLTGSLDIELDAPSGLRSFSCGSASAVGTVTSGPASGAWLRFTNPTGAPVTGSTCAGPAGLAMTLVATGTWSNLAAGPSTAAATDVVDGYLTGITLRMFTTASPALCDFTVTGLARTRFDEANQDLVIDETGFVGNLSATSSGTLCSGATGADLSSSFGVQAYDASSNAVGPINLY